MKLQLYAPFRLTRSVLRQTCHSAAASLLSGTRSLPVVLAASVVFSAVMYQSATPPGIAVTSEALKNWNSMMKEGTTALDSNEYWKAEPMLKQASHKAEELFGNKDLRFAHSLAELGRYYAVRGRFPEAEAYFEEELKVRGQALGNDRGKLIKPMGQLVRFYMLNGTAKYAEPLTLDLLDFVEGKLKEPDDVNKVRARVQKGAPLEAWAGQATPQMYDPLLEWAITCDDLGNIYKLKGKYRLADRLYKAALDTKATVLGKSHLSLANSYDSLGTLCMAKEEFEEAESYFKESLEISEKILLPGSPAIFGRRDKLAKCLIKDGKPEEAEKLYLQFLSSMHEENAKRGDEPRALFSLGCLYADQHKFAQAAPVLHKALNLSAAFNGPFSVALVPYMQKYAYVLYYLGRRGESDHMKARAEILYGEPLPHGPAAEAKTADVKSNEGKTAQRDGKTGAVDAKGKLGKKPGDSRSKASAANEKSAGTNGKAGVTAAKTDTTGKSGETTDNDKLNHSARKPIELKDMPTENDRPPASKWSSMGKLGDSKWTVIDTPDGARQETTDSPETAEATEKREAKDATRKLSNSKEKSKTGETEAPSTRVKPTAPPPGWEDTPAAYAQMQKRKTAAKSPVVKTDPSPVAQPRRSRVAGVSKHEGAHHRRRR